jgi:hypothetical protein
MGFFDAGTMSPIQVNCYNGRYNKNGRHYMESQLYLIWGKEAYLIDQEIDRIIRQLEEGGEEPEILSLDGDELTARELREQLEFSPLFSLHRVAIIKRPYWLGKAKKRGNKSEEYIKAVNDYLNGDGSGQTLIFTTQEMDKTNPLIKRLNKEARIIECNPPDKKFLGKWIMEQFKQRGRSCTRNCGMEGANHIIYPLMAIQMVPRMVNIEFNFSPPLNLPWGGKGLCPPKNSIAKFLA